MNDVQSLLTLPIETLIPLAAGYLSYRLAYTGRDATHTGVDAVLLSLVYAAISKLVIIGVSPAYFTNLLLAIAIPLACAAVWRKWIERGVFKLLRAARISASDRHETAWQTLIADDGMVVTQIEVRRKDGVTLLCQNTAPFEKYRTGPLMLGIDGSVALYITHQMGAADTEWEDMNPQDAPESGVNMTYIPASEIAFIKLRNK